MYDIKCISKDKILMNFAFFSFYPKIAVLNEYYLRLVYI